MNKILLSEKESYVKIGGAEKVDTRIAAYEVYIEPGIDKEGKPVLNKDGSQRYYPVDDDQLKVLDEDIQVRKIADNYFKPLYKIGDDLVEKVERDGKRVYYCVDKEQIVTLEKGTSLRESKSGCFRVVSLKGYVIYDETDMDNVKILSIKTFETENHKEEVEEVLKEMRYRHFVPYFEK